MNPLENPKSPTRESFNNVKRADENMRGMFARSWFTLAAHQSGVYQIGNIQDNRRRAQSSVIVMSAVPRRVQTSSVVSLEIGM